MRYLHFVILAAAVPALTLAVPTSEVRSLQQQVAALQLDHALNLTQPQAQALLPLLQSTKTQLQALKTQWTSSEPALVAALTQAVSDLKASGTVSASTVQAVQAARGGISGTFRQDLKSFWQQVKQIFTVSQLETLKTTPLGVVQPLGSGSGHKHFARRVRVTRTLLSDSFVSLVQARAG